jgi:exopolyphosphatase / guanosine-5'-triphosphate,3'-diphosphate pyrophosphatase
MAESTNRLIAAIDIGSSAIRMDVAEVRPDGTYHILDSLKKGVQLGKDTFTEGHISEEATRAACDSLKDFKQVMDTYGVMRYRAVATSAVRESSNSETFLDRVLMSTGLDVEIIDGSEENRLTLSVVAESLRGGPDISKGKTLLVEVGGGNADVTLLSKGELVQSGTFPLGSIRLRAGVSPRTVAHEQQIKLMKRQITALMASVKRSMEIKEVSNLIALGGDVRFAARTIAGAAGGNEPAVIPRDAFAEFVDSVARISVEGLVQKYALSYLDAETLAPALLTYLQMLKETQAEGLIVINASIRAGILQDLLPAEPGKRLKKLTQQILSAARSVGSKYQYDESHAERVRELSELLFDELKTEQRMNDTHRLYLQVAALLHDIGLFVSSRGHHKHSQYLISASGLFGLRQGELEIIGNVARYHRRAMPQRSHTAYTSLERDERVIVSKLAAILRVANALDKLSIQKASDLKVSREGDRIVLTFPNVTDLTMEKVALADRSDLFTEVFGKQIILRDETKLT